MCKSLLAVLAACFEHTKFVFALYVFVAYLAISMTSYGQHDDQLEYAKIEALLSQTNVSIAHEEAKSAAEVATEEQDLVMIDQNGEVIEETKQLPQTPAVNIFQKDFSFHLPIMSFNIRHDSEEYNPANHFTQRLPRIKQLFHRIKPWIAGLQEGSNGQIVHILSELSPHYKSVIYQSRDGLVQDSGASIFYDSNMLELQENETVWMSETPHVPFSKSWSTGSPRMLNMARFRLKLSTIQALLGSQQIASQTSDSETQDKLGAFGKQLSELDILVFNNHLDVWSEEARRAQSIFVGQRIEAWKQRFPRAFVVLTGDLNTAVGQRSYSHLTEENYAQQHKYSILKDAWIESPSKTNGVAHSFHGWQGTRLNNFVVRAFSAAAFTLFGMQMEMSRHIPNHWDEWKHALWNLFKVGPQFGVWESMPRFPYSRLHVDWILYQEPQRPTKAKDNHDKLVSHRVADRWLRIQPVQASLLDVRSENFSSDHYPLVVVFQIKPE